MPTACVDLEGDVPVVGVAVATEETVVRNISPRLVFDLGRHPLFRARALTMSIPCRVTSSHIPGLYRTTFVCPEPRLKGRQLSYASTNGYRRDPPALRPHVP